jgi:hypothetical protein
MRRRRRGRHPRSHWCGRAALLARHGVGMSFAIRIGDEVVEPGLEHRERRRQWFTALAVVPAPVGDRYLDEGG